MIRTKIVALFVALVSQLPLKRQPPPNPPPQPATAFRVRTDSAPAADIAGVVLPARGKAKGTVFLCHAYNRRKEDFYGLDWMRRELGWNLVAFDFREHGQSSRSVHLCSLGYHEIWDVKAVIDHAEKLGLPRPYVIYGASMGASVGLRWAARDSRVSGVLAVSPFRDGFRGAQQYLRGKFGVPLSARLMHRGYFDMISAVDLPNDLSSRDDLRVWIITGERDYWPVEDSRAILSGSGSPQSYKKLVVVPNGYHWNLWSWKGDRRCPSHDQVVRDFLRASR